VIPVTPREVTGSFKQIPWCEKIGQITMVFDHDIRQYIKNDDFPSVGMIIPFPKYMESHNPAMFQSTNQQFLSFSLIITIKWPISSLIFQK